MNLIANFDGTSRLPNDRLQPRMRAGRIMEGMAFPLSPAAIADLTRTAIGQVIETAAAAATVPLRVMTLLSQAELLVNRITVIADQAESLVGRVTTVVEAAEGTVADAR